MNQSVQQGSHPDVVVVNITVLLIGLGLFVFNIYRGQDRGRGKDTNSSRNNREIELEKENDDLRRHIANLEKLIENLEKQIENQDSKALKKNLKRLKSQENDLKFQIKSQNTKIENLHCTISDVMRKKCNLEEECCFWNTTSCETEQMLEETKIELRKQKDTTEKLKADMAQVTHHLEISQTELTQLGRIKITLQDEVIQRDAEINSLQDDLKQRDEEIDSLNERIHYFERKVQELEAGHLTLDQETMDNINYIIEAVKPIYITQQIMMSPNFSSKKKYTDLTELSKTTGNEECVPSDLYTYEPIIPSVVTGQVKPIIPSVVIPTLIG